MSFRLPESVRDLREEVRAFGDEEIRPVAREYDETREYPTDLRASAAEHGLIGPTIPEAYGGRGLDALASAVVTEELWRADTNLGWTLGLSGFPTNVHVLVNHADEWMREEWLPRIASAEAVDGIAVTEPNHGSDVAGMETRAERDGDEWVVNGEKKWIGNAPVADVLVLFAKTDPDAGHRGISAFLLPTDVEGVSTEEITDRLGGRSAPVGRVSLDDARIPADHLIGEENRGFYYFMEALPEARVVVGAQALGGAAAAFEATVAYATDREQFDRPIGEFQAVRHRIAGMSTKIEAARSLLYRAAGCVDRGDADAGRMASTAKLFATERASEVTDDAVQTHGGNGYQKAYDVERYYRDVRVTRIYEGTSDIQRNIIADDLL